VSESTASVFGAQGAAVAALAALVGRFGDLPGGYVTIHSQFSASRPVKLGLALQSPQAFEAWRAALGVAPESVVLSAWEGSVWLAAEVVFEGVTVKPDGFNVPLEPEVASATQEPAGSSEEVSA
jgi:hypothetical protein